MKSGSRRLRYRSLYQSTQQRLFYKTSGLATSPLPSATTTSTLAASCGLPQHPYREQRSGNTENPPSQQSGLPSSPIGLKGQPLHRGLTLRPVLAVLPFPRAPCLLRGCRALRGNPLSLSLRYVPRPPVRLSLQTDGRGAGSCCEPATPDNRLSTTPSSLCLNTDITARCC